MSYLLDRCVVRDAPMHDFVAQALSARPLLRCRWQMLGSEVESAPARPRWRP